MTSQSNRCFRPTFLPKPQQLPTTASSPRSTLLIQLFFDTDQPTQFSPSDLCSVIKPLNLKHDRLVLSTNGASLYFRQWSHTLTAFSSLWSLRLRRYSDFHYVPVLYSGVFAVSHIEELESVLKPLFVSFLMGLIDGDAVSRWRRQYQDKCKEIDEITRSLKRKNHLVLANRLMDKKNFLMDERDLIDRRIIEFREGINCILKHLERNQKVEDDEFLTNPEIFKFSGILAWEKIYRLALREIRRLEDGMPIYAYRKDILKQIQGQQILVLIGETGSGKSTLLVQFLADSGLGASKAIVCTQPRKIAAVSLAERVRKESIGCYTNKSVASFPVFSSAQRFGGDLVYTTDHCLLQHLMNDKNLSGVSCLIIDEAHERSLNTDILLALIKELLRHNHNLRVVIMSATADANQLSNYFFGCGIFRVKGRTYPVDIKYVPVESEESGNSSEPYVAAAVRMASEINRTEEDGAVLVFLTSQSEVEWACEKFASSSAIALPLHGKLSFEEQTQVFKSFSGQRKVIFATNVAETSITIPGVKFVVDCGKCKTSKFETSSGMNLLRVSWISQSSSLQRAGRAGRTSRGKCFRLYSKSDFDQMSPNDEPEIRRVHLGVAILRILALTSRRLQDFDFIDPPTESAVKVATDNLLNLDAIVEKDGTFQLTQEGRYLVKLGIEPRFGKLILLCYRRNLGKEGLVLASVMANSSSIFCRIGTNDAKYKADRQKVRFCHPDGDLFTLLSVFKEWEGLPSEKRNSWCWNNSINAKSMRRCQDTVRELDSCLKRELRLVNPSNWVWNPCNSSDHDKDLKEIILSILSDNVAMYSGCDKLGYEVASSGQYLQLHPSSSLLNIGERPSWVVFGEILSVSNQYLLCVNAVDFESVSSCSSLFDVHKMMSRKMQVKSLTGYGPSVLKYFCGKYNCYLRPLISQLQATFRDERINIEVNVDQNEVLLFVPTQHMESAVRLVTNALERDKRWIRNQCIEKALFHGSRIAAPVALLGAGAEIKHLELDKRSLSVDVFLSDSDKVDEKEILQLIEKEASGAICSVHKNSSAGENEKWASITFDSPDAAERASNMKEMSEIVSKVELSEATFVSDERSSPFSAVRANIYWPRRPSVGIGFLKCEIRDIHSIMCDLSRLILEGTIWKCERSKKSDDTIVLLGIEKKLSEHELRDMIGNVTKKTIIDFFLLRGDPVSNGPSVDSCQDALHKEISPFMSRNSPNGFKLQVFPPNSKDAFMKATMIFDGKLHLEAANALEHLEGKVLPGFQKWQAIHCQRLFQSSVSCSGSIFSAIEYPVRIMVKKFDTRSDVDCSLERTENGSYRVKIACNATKTIAELRKPLDELLKGRLIKNPNLTSAMLQHLYTWSGKEMMKSIERKTNTFILFDRQRSSVRIFGLPNSIADAEKKLVHSLQTYHEIHLRGKGLPADLMKELVSRYGPELNGLQEEVPGVELELNTRRHVIVVLGQKELKQRVEEMVFEIAKERQDCVVLEKEGNCPICLCPIDQSYRLESCSHAFCQMCLVEQVDSAIRNSSFPLCCARENCGAPILVADLRALLSSEKLDELFRASLGAFVTYSGGSLKFCPSPDCPSVYRTAVGGTTGGEEAFVCGACFAEICTSCHLEYHPFLSCEWYRQFKADPDVSLKEWRKGKEHVKVCPVCGYTIEKTEGCNHVECKCGQHICWVCLTHYGSSEDCYKHLRTVHLSFT